MPWSSPDYIRKRSFRDFCVEGWLEDTKVAVQQDRPSNSNSSSSHAQMAEPNPRLPEQLAIRPDQPVSPLKRRRMTTEVEASGSGSQSAWSQRLEETTEATSTILSDAASVSEAPPRSASPIKNIRKNLVDLKYTVPAISLGPPATYGQATYTGTGGVGGPQLNDGEEVEVIPEAICALIRRFSEHAATPSFGPEAMSKICTLAPMETFTPSNDTAANAYTSDALDPLMPHVSKLFHDAQDHYASSAEESSWYPLVRKLLDDLPHVQTYPSFFRVEEAQTRSLHSELLPRHGGPISTSKVDHLLQFNPDHPQIIRFLRPVFQIQPQSFSISAFNDANTARTFTAAIVEVKPPSGSFSEALYQVAIASAAILKRLQILDRDAHVVGDEIPVVSWIVHGHFWSLNIAYYCKDGSIVCGPFFSPQLHAPSVSFAPCLIFPSRCMLCFSLSPLGHCDVADFSSSRESSDPTQQATHQPS